MFEKLEADLNADPVLVAGPAAEPDIDAIEAFAGFPLPSCYREFVRRFGAAIVGPFPVFGSGVTEAMGTKESNVIGVTERFRSDGWPGVADTLVISVDHSGNAMTLNATGQVRR